jgi:hypothetical protein
MTLHAVATNTPPDPRTTLNLFCVKEAVGDADAFRVHIGPLFIPSYLSSCFDRHREAYPVFLDLEDLDRQMQRHGAAYDKRVSIHGDVELTASGRAAHVLGEWLATAFASGMRPSSGG